MIDEVDHRTPVHRLFGDGAPLLPALHEASEKERRTAAAMVGLKTALGFHSRGLLDAWMEALQQVEAAMTAVTNAGVV